MFESDTCVLYSLPPSVREACAGLPIYWTQEQTITKAELDGAKRLELKKTIAIYKKFMNKNAYYAYMTNVLHPKCV